MTQPPKIADPLVPPAVPWPATDDPAARAILDRARDAQTWTDRKAALSMRTIAANGREFSHVLSIYNRRLPRTQRIVIFVLAPDALSGTGLLTYLPVDGAPDQWLYIPELKRVRRIMPVTQGDGLVGSDVAFGDLEVIVDLTAWTADQASARLLGTSDVGDTPTDVLTLALRSHPLLGQKRTFSLCVDWLPPFAPLPPAARRADMSVTPPEPATRKPRA